jgi:hypothetical protein
MRRSVVVLVALVLAPPAAAAPRGAPTKLRVAGAADHASRAGALSEDWTLRLADPRSAAWLEVSATRSPDERGVRLRGVDANGRAIDDAFGAEPRASRRALDARSADGALAVRGAGRRVTLTGPAAAGSIRLVRTARGPAGLNWHLGETGRAPSFAPKPITASWSMLIATSRAKGSVTLRDGRRLHLGGWRGSYEHGWGDILAGDEEWDYLDSAVVHGKPGRAWVVRGLNRADTVTGPGARDAQWLGLLARIDRGRVKICRPRIDRRGWLFTYPDYALWGSRLRARCGGISLSLRDRRSPSVAEFIDHVEVRVRTRARTGLVTHVSHPIL